MVHAGRQRARSLIVNTIVITRKFYFAYAAFTLSGFANQERSLTFVKTAFQVLKLKFLASIVEQAFYPLHNKILRELVNKKAFFYKLSVWYLVVKPSCVNAALVTGKDRPDSVFNGTEWV